MKSNSIYLYPMNEKQVIRILRKYGNFHIQEIEAAAGMPKTTISQIIAGKRDRITPKYLPKLIEALKERNIK